MLFFYLAAFSWALSFFVGVAILLCMRVQSDVGDGFRIILGIVASLSCWGYCLGFALTFSLRDGVARYLVLLFLQLLLQPVFAVMEIGGVVFAIVSPPTKGFFVVQKESSGKRNANNDVSGGLMVQERQNAKKHDVENLSAALIV